MSLSLTVAGPSLDSTVAGMLRKEIDRLDLVGVQVCSVRLEHVKLVDSSGVGVLLALHRRLAAGNVQLRLVEPPDMLVRILTLLQLDQTLLT
ncbi:MAG: STAS domain-containing protein [Opitutales bacterium]